MKKDIQTVLKIKTIKNRQYKTWKMVVGLLSCVAIFLTFYFLMSSAMAQNSVSLNKLHLIDGYDTSVNELFGWKTEVPGKYTTSFDLNLHFVDVNGNYIQGKDLTLKLDNVNYLDVPYGFGYSPIDGVDVISSFNLKDYTLSTGEKYVFDHAEVLVDGVWRTFGVESGSYWHLWCASSSFGVEPDDENAYGWRGTYELLNDNGTYTSVAYTVTPETEYKFVFKLIRQGQSSSIASLGADSGISFNIFNYSGVNASGGDNNVNNNGVYDYFTFRDTSKDALYNINESLDADGFTENRIRVLPNLDADGNPVFDCRETTGCTDFSLGYLFGATKNPLNQTPNGVTSYKPNNTLLQKNSTTGYYYYDSNRNAVDYDTENNRFMVKNYLERTKTMTIFENEPDRYEFLPFTYWDGSSSIKTDDLSGRTYNYLGSEVDRWYGMTMEFTFYMPKDGIVNGSDMIFSFSGDDDVWVFIDDVLVLDLGGTHGAVDGNINFRTGEVKAYMNWDGVDNSGNPNTTSIYQSYIDANAIDKTNWNSNNTTYKNYTKHTLKFFYLERGAFVANCKIDFNIPVLPSGSLSVQKQYEGINNYPNDEYVFTLYDVTTNSLVSNTKYKVGENEYFTDSNGKFKLKNNEIAVFNLINEHSYYVEETDSGMHAVPARCTLDGADCPSINKTWNVTINPESAYLAIFTNKVKTYDFKVSKIAYNSTDTEIFDFKITLNDINDINGSPIDVTNINFTDKCSVDNLKGIATFSLKNNESITISNIPIDTIVTLEETKHDGYKTLIKSGETLLADGDKLDNIRIDSNKDITVYNIPGVKLPDTGGFGTFKYLIVGIGLILISIGYGYSYFFKMKGSDE